MNITFQVYDLPNHPGTFEERLKELNKIVRLTRARWKEQRKQLPYPMNKLDVLWFVPNKSKLKMINKWISYTETLSKIKEKELC